jgi:hypothetical protein
VGRMTEKPIVDHSWRPPDSSGVRGTTRSRGPVLDRPCEYMNCRRPLAEHARYVSGRYRR